MRRRKLRVGEPCPYCGHVEEPSFDDIYGKGALKRLQEWLRQTRPKPGFLREALGVPKGKRIHWRTLEKAGERDDHVGAQARLALNLRRLRRH